MSDFVAQRAGELSSSDSDAVLIKKAAEIKERAMAKAESLAKYEKKTPEQQERARRLLFKSCHFDGRDDSVYALQTVLSEGVDVDALLDDGHYHGLVSAVWRAAQTGHSLAVACLVQNGANYDKQASLSLCSPLFVACEGGHYNCVDYLLRQGCDTGAKGMRGEFKALVSPYRAASNRDDERGEKCIDLMDEAGVTPDGKLLKCSVM